MKRVEVEQQQHNYQKLPDECWEKILSHLNDKYDRESLSLTCKKFLSLTDSSRVSLSFFATQSVYRLSRLLERFPYLRKLKICDYHCAVFFVNHAIALIAQSNLNLEELDLSFQGSLQTVCLRDLGSRFKLKVLKLCCTVTNADLITIADTFPLLEEILTRDNCLVGGVGVDVAVNDEGVHYLSSKLKKLHTVDIYHRCISDESLFSLASNCAFLEHFMLRVVSVSDVPIRVTENGISFLVKNCSHLKSLAIISCLKMECFVPKSCSNLLNLQTLNLEFLDISDEFLYSITEAQIPLTHFHLNLCKGYSFVGIWKLLNTYRSLKTLVLGSVEFLTNEHIDKLSPFMHNLTSIRLMNCPLLSDSAFVVLTQRCPLLCDIDMSVTCLGKEEYEYDDLNLKKNFSVKHLYLLMSKYLSTSTLRRLLSICPKVEKLNLLHCFESNVQQLDIVDVLECSRDLLHLDISHCHVKFTRKYMEFSMIENLDATHSDINDEMLVELVKICPRLLHLKMFNCQYVTDEGVKEVVKSCQRLRSLVTSGSMNVNAGLEDWIQSNYPSVIWRVAI